MKDRRRRRLAVAALVAMLCAGASRAAEPPQRVVSMNICTDQLALLTAKPGQLLSVTWIARDEARNPLAGLAHGLHANRGEAEEVLALAPDLVLTGTFTTRMTVAALRRRGIHVVELPPMESLADLEAQTRTVARLLGNDAAAEGVLSALPVSIEVTASSPRALMLGPAGSSAGPKSLGGDLLRAAGFANIASSLPPAPWTNLTIEEIRWLAPDLVVTAEDDGVSASLARALLAHPALRGETGFRRLSIPRGASSCAAPIVAEALSTLQAARQ